MEFHQENENSDMDLNAREQSSEPTDANIKGVKAIKVLGKGAQGLVVLCERDTISMPSRFVLKIFSHFSFEKQSQIRHLHHQINIE